MKRVIITGVALLPWALWIGGLLVLGAIVAPSIFGHVRAPDAASAMTIVFRRFDRVALVCAAALLGCEVAFAMTTRPIGRSDLARAAVVVGMSGLCIWQATVLSPRIESLHRAGVVRGEGELGVAFERAHKLAEGSAKTQVVLGLGYLVLLVAGLRGRRSAANKVPSSGPPSGRAPASPAQGGS
jgi:uncharacterized membrane protein